MKRDNQARSFFSYKNDDEELVELGQFIRETRKNYRVEREWYVIFAKNNGSCLGVNKTFNGDLRWTARNPDLILMDKKMPKIILVIELDGFIHRRKEMDTEDRNEQYEKAGVPLLVINKWEIDTNIFDYTNRKLEEIL